MKDFNGNIIDTHIDKVINGQDDNVNGMRLAEKQHQFYGYGFKFLCVYYSCLVFVNNELFVLWLSGTAGTDISARRIANNEIRVGNSITYNIEDNKTVTFKRGDKAGENYVYLSSSERFGWHVIC